MLKAWNKRVRTTSAMSNALANVRTVSANPPCRRLGSFDTLIVEEHSGLSLAPLPRGEVLSYSSLADGAHLLLDLAPHAYAHEGVAQAAAQKLIGELMDAPSGPELRYPH